MAKKKVMPWDKGNDEGKMDKGNVNKKSKGKMKKTKGAKKGC